MKPPKPELLKEQLALQSQLESLRSEQDAIKQKITKKRFEIDEFIRVNKDQVAANAGWERHQAFLKRQTEAPPVTPERQAWFDKIKADNLAFMHSMSGTWWSHVEGDIPIPFIDVFFLVDPSFIGPLEKDQVWTTDNVSHILVKLGDFKSITEAKNAGKAIPFKTGENRVKLGHSMRRLFIEMKDI